MPQHTAAHALQPTVITAPVTGRALSHTDACHAAIRRIFGCALTMQDLTPAERAVVLAHVYPQPLRPTGRVHVIDGVHIPEIA